jgi:hypothetical protein
MGHSFLQRSGTLGGDFVTEEDDLRCFKYALRRVDKDPTLLEPVEECS